MKVFMVIPLLLLIGCAEVPPKSFSTGEIVNPPYGCVEARKEHSNEPC